jgi:hypothetical protein
MTLRNLASEYLKIAPELKRLVLCSIVNWLPEGAEESFSRDFPLKVGFASLLEGSFEFFPKAQIPEPSLFNSVGDFSLKTGVLTGDHGRLGLIPQDLPALRQKVKNIADSLGLPPLSGARVIGTGEFLFEPFLLARRLEELGLKVVFQSTTRTPAAPGGGIKSILRFPDNYYENLDNFLYNLEEDFEGETLVAYETKSLPPEHDLPTRIRAKTVFF